MTLALAPDLQPGQIRPGTWRAVLTPGLTLLNSNQRLHPKRRADYTRALRGAGYTTAAGAIQLQYRQRIHEQAILARHELDMQTDEDAEVAPVPADAHKENQR